ncbi:hypothetical protein [Burkholderia cenocepacia]|uniref:hypothetical protein n=1 Tax=Burkholderia cenocepacia TaxID=95486 RepID=UPI00286688CB|nr:hypothetical protein [Burkholderia cenocepacia]MDR8057624.1 hypothetical protein [Burkholderia cenocepacia]MDR8062284.1 hypothetical protein [Burkholderia cenocepacia]
MLTAAIPAYAYWAGTMFIHSIYDPQSTANDVAFVLPFIVAAMAYLGLRMHLVKRSQARLSRYRDWMEKTLQEHKQARLEGREHELEDLTISAGDVKQAGWELITGRRRVKMCIAGLAILGVLVALGVGVIALCWGNWWLEGGYKCTAPGVVVHNQLDPQAYENPMMAQPVNLCDPGVFTLRWSR